MKLCLNARPLFVNKVLLEKARSLHLHTSLSAFTLQWQSQRAVTGTTRLAKFNIIPLRKCLLTPVLEELKTSVLKVKL